MAKLIGTWHYRKARIGEFVVLACEAPRRRHVGRYETPPSTTKLEQVNCAKCLKALESTS